ncbi:hypothetical protein CEP52_001413 [Fusarium oligoseptatum]|uniref:Uncharacterized protein n=1 Tax=Fusarium oligoseptatum TaxID=2604345 RepID=A0A428UIU4_9HYPO|nr:hypothetical protein CEP52_001413 [Fusarium oligoseptatum]
MNEPSHAMHALHSLYRPLAVRVCVCVYVCTMTVTVTPPANRWGNVSLALCLPLCNVFLKNANAFLVSP